MTSSRHFAAVTSLLLASAALIVPPLPAQAKAPVVRLAQSVLDTRPSAELSDEELTRRIEQFRVRLQSGAPLVDGVDLRPILNQDRQELRRRRSEGAARPAQPQPADEPKQAEPQQVQPPGAVGDQEGKPQLQPQPQQATPKAQPDQERARSDSRQGDAQDRFDARPSAQLSDEELARRIEQVRARLQAGEKRVGRVNLRPLHNQDRQELRRRRAEERREAAPQPEPQPQLEPRRRVEPAPPPDDKAAPKPAPLQAAPQQAEPQPQQPAPRRAEEKPRRPKIEFNLDLGGRRSPADEQAIDILRDRRELSRLSDADLRERIRLSRRTLDDNRLDSRLREPLQAQLEDDRDELQARLGGRPSYGGSDADRVARRFLAERRPPSALSQEELQGRVQDARSLLASEDLSPGLFAQVRARLRDDREELRRRVADREAQQQRRRDEARERIEDRPRERDQVFDRRLYSVRDLLNDRRPSRSLSDRVLQLRILSAREALRDGRLLPRQRQRIEAMLDDDRRERRARLFAERERRREDLRRTPSSGGLRLVIPPLVAIRPLPDIAAAEVDDEALERQLIAPPRERIGRRYSLEDIENRSDLRGIMPGIELDTIRFGFNEYQVREEEIDKLDGIAAIIERILAAQPDEIFMIEGHTDAVGSDGYNLELSRRRAEAVKGALSEYFVIDPDALVTVGYGERYLKIPTPDEEPENRRVTVRRITPLLTGRAD